MSVSINVGLIDRVLRLGISVVLFYLALFYPSTSSDAVTSYTLIAVAAINAVVALIGICPIYLLIGVNTHNSESE